LCGFGVDAHDAGAAVLGRTLDPLAADDGGGSGDSDLGPVHADVSPAKVEQLTPARPV